MKADQCNKKSLFCCVRSFFNRFLSLLLILALLPACLAVSVMADEVDLPYYDVLDYGYVNNGDSNIASLSSGQPVNFFLTSRQTLYYYDVLVFSTNEILSAYGWNGDSGSSPTVEYIGESVYRIYGHFSGSWASYFSLEFTFASSDISYVTFYSCRVWTFVYEHLPTTVSGSVNALGLPNQLLYPNYPSSPYVAWSYSSWDQYQGAYTDGLFTGRFYFSDWQKFDFCEMQLNAIVKSISSVAAYLGDQVVPIEVSIVENSGSTPANFYINVVADMRGFRRDTDDILVFVVDGIADFEMTNQISIFDAEGKVLVSDSEPWLVWFSRLNNWLSTGFSSVTSSLSSLGSSIAGYISDQTTSITNSFTSLQSHITGRFNDLRNWVNSGYMTITLYIQTWGQNISSTITSGVDLIVDAITGGENADDLQNGANQIGEAGSSLGSNIDSIHDFEDQYFGQLDSNMGSIVAGGNLSGIVAPLSFVYRYSNMIVAGIPSNFLVIFTLPILLGIFMYIVGHPIKAPRPDTSGDIVTRETFTETTILSGPGAGRTRSTRTVTTSTEIGRVHNE